MTRLTDLDPEFLHRCADDGQSFHYGGDVATAQGIWFECPKCRRYSILVWFKDRGVPAAVKPLPRWSVSGTGLNDLTITPSIDLSCNSAGCHWHGFVTNGDAA